MSAPDAPDEFDQIAKLFRPLTRGAPEALDLMDDAAMLTQRAGYDLVLTKDAIVEGVHFLPADPPDLVARKLLRVNLSDLAAKGAEPFGYLLAVGWPSSFGASARRAFAEGLRKDGEVYGISLLGGDTVSTSGPWFASVTALGWVPAGRMVRRAGARPGDLVVVSGPIGDGWLGLKAARGEIADADGALARRYRLPNPRLDLRAALREYAGAAADVSDGLVADAGHIATASGVRIDLDLALMPLSTDAARWVDDQAKAPTAVAALATGGDDYELVFTCAPKSLENLVSAAPEVRVIGRVSYGEGVAVTYDGEPVALERIGYQHS